MFNTLSMTGTGIIVSMVMVALKYYNIAGVNADAVTSFITSATVVVGFIWTLWGHIRSRTDLTMGLIRK